jgi:cytochrome c2
MPKKNAMTSSTRRFLLHAAHSRSMTVWVVAAGVAFAPWFAHAGGDARNGAALFNRCSICHSNTKGGPNKIGPNLFGVVGRKAGTYPGFSYSAAIKRSGITWTPEKLSAYLTSPQQAVPGNNMPFAGIDDAKQRTDIVAYLATLK